LPAQDTFDCVVIGPAGKLLDCKTSSVVFPAHDGQVGVWRNHAPMFCQLGLGVVQVKRLTSDIEKSEDMFLLVDGGFAVVCSNLLKVVSYDVIFPHDLKPEALEHIIYSLKKKLSSTPDLQERQHLAKKLAFLQQFQQSSSQPVNAGN
jgi:F0F1-type ATP synthase epsilon subunit